MYGDRCSIVAVLFCFVLFLSGGQYFAGKFEKGKGYPHTENFMSLVLSIKNAGTKEIGTFCWSIISILLFTFQVPNSIVSMTFSGIRGTGVKSPGRKSGGREGEEAWVIWAANCFPKRGERKLSETLKIVLACSQNLVLGQCGCALIVSPSLLPFPRFLSSKSGKDSLLFSFHAVFPDTEVNSVAKCSKMVRLCVTHGYRAKWLYTILFPSCRWISQSQISK